VAESDDPADAASRLEAALERIARHARSQPAAPGVDTTGIAARLDALIAQLRAVLGSSANT
jgi:hypothetical protein